jgi:hypothetical protein
MSWTVVLAGSNSGGYTATFFSAEMLRQYVLSVLIEKYTSRP